IFLMNQIFVVQNSDLYVAYVLRKGKRSVKQPLPNRFLFMEKSPATSKFS
ncbi:MAG: hypothetical protein RLZZ557_1282, partial [Bacteroidota bacterium]